MKIYFFERDPQTKIIYAGCKAESKRAVYPVWCADGRYYASDDRGKTFRLNPAQVDALAAFAKSKAYSIEYKEGI